ncbi:MAG: sialidase family protein [Verrucomicrobiota bacterium]|nr:sialidase family protein [Verrucomicrobiota bacterium]
MKAQPISRRLMLRQTTTLGLSAILAPHVRTRAAKSLAKVHDIRIVSLRPNHYHGWPTLARRRNGQLLLICTGGREGHVCPFGQVELMRSDDDGVTWSFPRVLLDLAIDDRDAGIIETDKGTLLATTFSSLAYEHYFRKGTINKWDTARQARWRGVHNRISEAERKAQLGTWMLRSIDGGVTWSTTYDSIVNSPHGPIQLADGRQLYAGKDLWKTGKWIGVCESKDDGKSWQKLAQIPTRPGDNPAEYHELHAIEAANGTIVAQIRNHNAANNRETLQSESTDGGKTWSLPHATGIWGLPSHLMRLKNGRLLTSYGYRRKPFGNQARISDDHGKTWSDPITISGDGTNGDLGYPSSVELTDGTMLTAWYEQLSGNSRAVLRLAKWSLL